MTAAVERRIATILFADLVGFTPLSESLDPEDVGTVQKAYFATVRDTVARHGGLVEKFIGDAAMAVFGVPVARDDDAERAVRAGLALVAAVGSLAPRLGLDETLALRVGVNTGEVVGAVDPDPGAALVSGDPVNVAARLQGAAEPDTVLLGPTTALAVADAVELGPARRIAVKGKAESVRVSVALGIRAYASREFALGSLHAPLLGRRAELSTLIETVTAVAPNSAQRWVLVSPPGVGKTRLMRELAAAVPRTHVWWTRARQEAAPYDAVASLMREALSSAAAPSDADALRRELSERLITTGVPPARVAAVVDEVAALLVPEGATRAADRDAAFTAWLDALDALAGDRPVLVAFEDVHWAALDVLDFVAAAGARAAPSGRVVIATARPALLDRASTWCDPTAPGGPQLLELEPLTDSAIEALVEALVGAALPPELVARIVERAGGTPLFVEELVRTWIAAGTLVFDDGAWRLSAGGDVPLPPTVQGVYAAQLDDLPPAARDAARRASVFGRRVAGAALRDLGALDPPAALETLVRRGFLTADDDDGLGPTFVFRHALLRDAAYASLARSDRAALHVRLAAWLAARNPADARAASVGEQYAAALESVPALATEVGDGLAREEVAALAAAAFERGADHAARFAAQDSARALLARALEHTPAAPSLDRVRRLRGLATATAAVADMEAARGMAEDAFALARSLHAGGDPGATGELAAAAADLAAIELQQVRIRAAHDLANQTLPLVRGTDTRGEARLFLTRALATAGTTSESARPLADAERALAIARRSGDPDLELDALSWFFASRVPDRTILGRAHFAAARALARRLRRWATLAQTLEAEAVYLADDEPDPALALLADAEVVADARGLRESRAWVHYLRAEAYLRKGDEAGARDAALRAIELGSERAYHRVVLRSWALLSVAAASDDALVARARSWWTAARGALLRHVSPFGRVVYPALELGVAPEPDARLLDYEFVVPGLRLLWGLPSRLAAIEVIVCHWAAIGRVADAQSGVAELERAAREPVMSEFARATAVRLRRELEARH